MAVALYVYSLHAVSTTLDLHTVNHYVNHYVITCSWNVILCVHVHLFDSRFVCELWPKVHRDQQYAESSTLQYTYTYGVQEYPESDVKRLKTSEALAKHE